MARAIDIARYLIQLAALEEEPEPLTHMRLQKLLYYVQGWSLAFRGEPMFPETIEAWKFGPVVRNVYPLFANYGDGAIPPGEAGEACSLEENQKSFIVSIWEGYKRHSAFALSEKTHREAPWSEAYARRREPERCEEEISHESMRLFFLEEYRKHAKPFIDPEKVRQAEQDLREGRFFTLEEVMKELGDAV